MENLIRITNSFWIELRVKSVPGIPHLKQNSFKMIEKKVNFFQKNRLPDILGTGIAQTPYLVFDFSRLFKLVVRSTGSLNPLFYSICDMEAKLLP
jgi:hypothetical protein